LAKRAVRNRSPMKASSCSLVTPNASLISKGTSRGSPPTFGNDLFCLRFLGPITFTQYFTRG
jgi:hypothetical protein